jgi:hypothetical protein
MPGGISLELDTAQSARLWHAAWRTDPATVGVVIGFSLPTREAVDERYAESLRQSRVLAAASAESECW